MVSAKGSTWSMSMRRSVWTEREGCWVFNTDNAIFSLFFGFCGSLG